MAGQPPETRFDLIAVDAYRPPYIPFHLTTVEFFDLARQRLSEDGILAVNEQEVGSVKQLQALLARPVERWRVALSRDGKVLNWVIEK